ncbi:hypothetical protein SELMODRAFT_78013 [Selaginella moellendorffii]|uniref:Manganese-dependent ADP-ribose/CDP-alcohol diphosphatase n=1 Tax=Selaginella moellendorffii TaxID=88036 RepID=D8QW42_SELML|nr:manganese-dependent ADP-ribose/CDP-alcohol diphosphatase isoform X1 [Selaginella moellendorffii]EFJ36568.1 hypothetical protein SELMODRAFT_78013 [Selaginella moellendorffii]|eukprot:XP_024515097.1 manganese-dependent ADP-ribose/CDP-alcohol diphosphatase isoform X1 [Selaginella moellendorffii]
MKDLHSSRPLFSFGVITDVQYADVPDGRSFHGVPRFYRGSLAALNEAIAIWNDQGSDLSFVIQLGDLIDGRCPRDQAPAAAREIVAAFDRFRHGHVYHTIGNHCLYNLSRGQLQEILRIDGSFYYDFVPHPGFRFIVLDSYDVSVLGGSSRDHSSLAMALLDAKNPNVDKNSPLGMAPEQQRFVAFNGGIGDAQLQWLDRKLREAEDRNERVIIACHIPILRESTYDDTLLWNAEEVLRVIHRYDRCVVASLAGHKHDGGEGVDEKGIHHRVLEAVLECPPGENSFGRVDVYEDRLELLGTGRMRSATVFFR